MINDFLSSNVDVDADMQYNVITTCYFADIRLVTTSFWRHSAAAAAAADTESTERESITYSRLVGRTTSDARLEDNRRSCRQRSRHPTRVQA